MEYWTILKNKKTGEPYHLFDNLLDLVPEHVIEAMESRFVDNELNLCRECPIACHPHVISESGKLCPVLFCDAYKPGWTPDQLA